MSLAGCVTTIFSVVAVKRKFQFSGLRVELEGEKPKDANTITRIKGQVEVVTAAAEQKSQTLLNLTLDACPVGVLFKQTGIGSEWHLNVRKQ